MMDFFGVNFVAIAISTIAGMAIGAFWYGALAKPWMKAANLTEEQIEDKPSLYGFAALAQIGIAIMMAGLIGHLGDHTLKLGLVTGFFVWLGFCMPTHLVNHRFQFRSWNLTFIDTGFWLIVFCLHGAIIGALGVE